MQPEELLQERRKRGEYFKLARLKKNITFSQLSQRTGISRETLGKIESGKSAWSINTEIIIMQALGIQAIEGHIEIGQDGNKITSLKITGVNLVKGAIS